VQTGLYHTVSTEGYQVLSLSAVQLEPTSNGIGRTQEQARAAVEAFLNPTSNLRNSLMTCVVFPDVGRRVRRPILYAGIALTAC